jgi:hypothetical protein
MELTAKTKETFIRQMEKCDFVVDIVTAFLAADIPLKKPMMSY